LVDFNRESLAVARKNVRRNKVSDRCEAVHSEAGRFLASRFERKEKFEAIDLDPFGTPAALVLAVISAASDRGMVSMTATDAAVLCGVYPQVCFRRYGALAVRSDFVHETGLRILLGFAARMGGINDLGVEPVAAHSTLHYLRVYFRVRRGASSADGSVRNLGFVTQCSRCCERFTGEVALERCPGCGSRVRSAGPLWTGRLVDKEVVEGALRFAKERGWKEASETLGSQIGIDLYPPHSYSPERACSRLRLPSVSTSDLLSALEAAGFRAARQPFEEIGIKTDAAYGEFVSALRKASGQPSQAH
jgi:tRNA (guanine26-N2/guanine27-N2)-dimethyltransferase